MPHYADLTHAIIVVHRLTSRKHMNLAVVRVRVAIIATLLLTMSFIRHWPPPKLHLTSSHLASIVQTGIGNRLRQAINPVTTSSRHCPFQCREETQHQCWEQLDTDALLYAVCAQLCAVLFSWIVEYLFSKICYSRFNKMKLKVTHYSIIPLFRVLPTPLLTINLDTYYSN